MSERYRRSATMPPLDMRGKAEMDRASAAEIETASSGKLIKALEARGYRVFPISRIQERPLGWFVQKTEFELAKESKKQCS